MENTCNHLWKTKHHTREIQRSNYRFKSFQKENLDTWTRKEDRRRKSNNWSNFTSYLHINNNCYSKNITWSGSQQTLVWSCGSNEKTRSFCRTISRINK